MSDLLLNLENAFHGKGWQGPTLLGSIRGVSPAEALVIPRGLKHSIWHLILHAAYWKYAVCLRIERAGVSIRNVPRDGGDDGELKFPRSPSNWPSVPAKETLSQWRADIDLLKTFHAGLIDAASRLTPRQLDSIPPGGKSVRLRPMIVGIAAHDAYHCGQIQVLKRLVRSTT